MYLGIHLISSNMAPIASVSEEYSTLGIRRIAISSLKYGIPIWEIDDGKVWRLQSFSFSVKQLSTWHRMGRKCGVCVYGLAMDRLWKSSSTLMSVNNIISIAVEPPSYHICCRFLPAKLTSRFLLPISSRQIDDSISLLASLRISSHLCAPFLF